MYMYVHTEVTLMLTHVIIHIELNEVVKLCKKWHCVSS